MVLPEAPALVVGHIDHTRRAPLRHTFRNRSYQWFVDVDDLPRLPFWLRPLASFRAEDHLAAGASGGGIRGDLQEVLDREGHALGPSDRVFMLANARVLGHVFDPLSIFWVQGEDAAIRTVVFEVHNTYGGRHSYVLDVDDRGRARTDKVFYVSPFNDVSGGYEIRLGCAPDRIRVAIGLDRGGERILTATSDGRPQPATAWRLIRLALTHLLMPQRVSALIRFHGILLWLRRLPVHPRPKSTNEVAS